MSASRPGWRLRLGAAAALMVAYLLVWRPLRVAIASLIAPSVFEGAGAAPVAAGPHAAVVLVGPDALQWAAPAGALFLLGALVLVVARPRWQPLLAFWGAHCALGVLAAGAVIAAAKGSPWGFWANDLVQTYLVPGLTLATMALALVLRDGASGENAQVDETRPLEMGAPVARDVGHLPTNR